MKGQLRRQLDVRLPSSPVRLSKSMQWDSSSESSSFSLFRKDRGSGLAEKGENISKFVDYLTVNINTKETNCIWKQGYQLMKRACCFPCFGQGPIIAFKRERLRNSRWRYFVVVACSRSNIFNIYILLVILSNFIIMIISFSWTFNSFTRRLRFSMRFFSATDKFWLFQKQKKIKNV